MPVYRDDLEAARHRSDALERELAELKNARSMDARRMAALQQQLHYERQRMAQLGQYAQPYGYAPQPILPSNASTVLVLGILSVVFCAILGPFAWSQGNTELHRIACGVADPRKRGEVVAGKVLGIIGSAILITGMVGVVFAFTLFRSFR